MPTVVTIKINPDQHRVLLNAVVARRRDLVQKSNSGELGLSERTNAQGEIEKLDELLEQL